MLAALMNLFFEDILIKSMLTKMGALKFGPPVAYVYNPLEYARRGFDTYWRRYGQGPKQVVLVGMNPGPWGMAQTGVPFGEVEAVARWMKIDPRLEKPSGLHPKKPVLGLECHRREVSGKRLWSWARERYASASVFFSRFFVLNYCPLMFLDQSGRNLALDKLPMAMRRPLMEICDQTLAQWLKHLEPEFVVGIGNFAYQRVLEVVNGMNVVVGKISHPSPANPRANKGWAEIAEQELEALGIVL